VEESGRDRGNGDFRFRRSVPGHFLSGGVLLVLVSDLLFSKERIIVTLQHFGFSAVSKSCPPALAAMAAMAGKSEDF
jgi:hypothetical protein